MRQCPCQKASSQKYAKNPNAHVQGNQNCPPKQGRSSLFGRISLHVLALRVGVGFPKTPHRRREQLALGTGSWKGSYKGQRHRLALSETDPLCVCPTRGVHKLRCASHEGFEAAWCPPAQPHVVLRDFHVCAEAARASSTQKSSHTKKERGVKQYC